MNSESCKVVTTLTSMPHNDTLRFSRKASMSIPFFARDLPSWGFGVFFSQETPELRKDAYAEIGVLQYLSESEMFFFLLSFSTLGL